MAITLDNIQTKMAATLDQSTTTPTQGGSEWNVRKEFINRAVEEWSNAYDWEALKQNSFITVTGVSQASLTLPTSFRKMAAFPLNYSYGIEGGKPWEEIQSSEIKLRSLTDSYFYVLGNRGDGFTMIWNPGTLASGASLFIQYFSFPTSLVSPADVSDISDPEYLVDRAIAYVLEARSDARFQEVEQKAREKLLLMVDNDNVKGESYDNTVKTPERLINFRIGRD